MKVAELLKILQAPAGFSFPTVEIRGENDNIYYSFRPMYNDYSYAEYVKSKEQYGDYDVLCVRVCGEYDDVPYLEIIIKNTERKDKNNESTRTTVNT